LFELASASRGAAGGRPRNFLRRIIDSLILDVCIPDGMTKVQRLDLQLDNHLEFSGEELVDLYQQEAECGQTKSECSQIHIKVHNHCTSLLTIVEFLKLVQGLFAIDPIQNEQMRAVIQEVFTD